MRMTTRIAALAVLAIAAGAQEQPSVTIEGVSGRSIVVYTAYLSSLRQYALKTIEKGTPVTFEGVLLSDVLEKVDGPVGEKYHGTAASYYLVAEGKDGYRAVFAWAEVDTSFMEKSVYLIISRDGKPLPEKDGPIELVAPGEKRAARSVRQLTALRIRQAK